MTIDFHVPIKVEIRGTAGSSYTLDTIERAYRLELAKPQPDPEALRLLQELLSVADQSTDPECGESLNTE